MFMFPNLFDRSIQFQVPKHRHHQQCALSMSRIVICGCALLGDLAHSSKYRLNLSQPIGVAVQRCDSKKKRAEKCEEKKCDLQNSANDDYSIEATNFDMTT